MAQLDIIEHFKKNDCHGNGLIVKGGIRRGKTYLIAIITKLLLINGFTVISNVRFEDTEFIKWKGKLHYISTDLEYFKHYLNVPENTPIVLVWDDIQAQKGFKSTDHEQFSKLSSFLIFMGKFDSNYVYVAHQKYIPDCITDGFEPLFIYKRAREYFYACMEFHESSKDKCKDCVYVSQPTPNQIKGLAIKSKAFSRFQFVIDLEGLYDYLSRYEIGEQIRKGVREYLDKSDTDNAYTHLQNLSLKEIAFAIYFKRGVIKDSTPLNEFINPNTLSSVKKIYRKMI